jgi:membrane protein
MPGKSHRRKILTRSFMSFMENDLTTAAAAVSYFSMLALFPTLVLLLSIGSRLLGPETVQKYVIGQVLAFLPGASTFVSKNLESISGISSGIILSCVLVMLWASSWMFTVIEKALNRVWGTYPRSFLSGRAVNIAVMSLVFFLLAASALFTAFVTGVKSAAERIPLKLNPWLAALSGLAWQTIFVIASLAVTVILFAVLYKLLPNTKVSVLEALPGAVLAGVFWEAAKFGFAFMLPYFHYDLLYGSIGAGVALLTWVYMSSVIMLFGAQFTALLHRDHLFNAASPRADHASGQMPAVES